jgi:hypothetical protein
MLARILWRRPCRYDRASLGVPGRTTPRLVWITSSTILQTQCLPTQPYLRALRLTVRRIGCLATGAGSAMFNVGSVCNVYVFGRASYFSGNTNYWEATGPRTTHSSIWEDDFRVGKGFVRRLRLFRYGSSPRWNSSICSALICMSMARSRPARNPQKAPRSERRPTKRTAPSLRRSGSPKALRARRKFIRFFPAGFRDETYLDWERSYKWKAHLGWLNDLNSEALGGLIERKRYADVTAKVIRIESRTNLLFSFEKMALRDAVRSHAGAKIFALALVNLLHGPETMEVRFNRWLEAVDRLPRRQTRVLTWPLVTVFGFIAQPKTHVFLKPRVTQEAARRYGEAFAYEARPSWEGYKSLLNFVGRVRTDISDMRPRDMIDLQSFLWVQGSDEYPD